MACPCNPVHFRCMPNPSEFTDVIKKLVKGCSCVTFLLLLVVASVPEVKMGQLSWKLINHLLIKFSPKATLGSVQGNDKGGTSGLFY